MGQLLLNVTQILAPLQEQVALLLLVLVQQVKR